MDQAGEVREEAARALGSINDPVALEPLITALEDERVTGHAVFFALGELGNPKAVPAIIAAIRKAVYPMPYGRNYSNAALSANLYGRRALVKIGHGAVQPLINILLDENEFNPFREIAADLIEEMGVSLKQTVGIPMSELRRRLDFFTPHSKLD